MHKTNRIRASIETVGHRTAVRVHVCKLPAETEHYRLAVGYW